MPAASLQAVELLGMKADDLAPLKEAADTDDLEALLKRCQFTQWLLRVQTRTRCTCRLPSTLRFEIAVTTQLTTASCCAFANVLSAAIHQDRTPSIAERRTCENFCIKFLIYRVLCYKCCLLPRGNLQAGRQSPTLLVVACREYEGKLSQRINVQSMQPLDFAAENRMLAEQIEKLSV